MKTLMGAAELAGCGSSQPRFRQKITAYGTLGCLLYASTFCLLGEDVRAEKFPGPLDIQVHGQGFGAAPGDIAAVLNSAASEIWPYCRGTRLSGIDVYYRGDHPQTDFNRNSQGRLSIELSARQAHWAQYSFQFAHEFCHAIANFSDSSEPLPLARHALSANLWFEESLCETASLFVLRAMSRSWKSRPPQTSWRSYASWFNIYAEQQLARREHQLPSGVPFSDWFQSNQAALRQNPMIRDWNTIIAIRFLPLFEAEPRGWETVTFLNHGPHQSNESLKRRLFVWRAHCPQDLRSFVDKLAELFGIRLL